MHRLLFGEENIPAKMEIDHINGKPYDNRRSKPTSGKIKAGANRGQHKLPVMAFGITLAILILQKKLQKQWLQNENNLLLSSHEHRRICSMVHGGHANAELP